MGNAKTIKMDMNFPKLIEDFGTNERCRKYLELLRWQDGMQCPRCESGKISPIKDRPQYDCDACHYQFSVTTGTVLHDTHLPLWKWFAAAYMMIEAKKGVSANQLKRTLAVSYKTAWYLCHRIRKAMEAVNAQPLTGTVEVDETYLGRKARGVGTGNYKAYKSLIVGALQRDGEVRIRIEKRADRKTLHKFVADHCANETEKIYTHAYRAYRGIQDHNTKHESVDHNIDEWVRGNVHTNGIEGVWSLLKRSIFGSYHRVSKKHLDRYLDEFQFRFNNRKNEFLFRDTIMKLMEAPTLTYAALTA